MWIELTENEKQLKRTAYAKKQALLWSSLITILTLITTKIGYNKYDAPSTWQGVSWLELAESSHYYVFGGLTLYVVIFLYQKTRPTNNSAFCLTCKKTYQDTTIKRCSCGGNVGLIDNYKYVNDDANQKKP